MNSHHTETCLNFQHAGITWSYILTLSNSKFKIKQKHKCALNRGGIFCLRVSQENYPKVNLLPDVLDISILCRRTEEVPRTSIKSEFFPPQKENLLCCRQNSISYQSKYHFRRKTYELTFVTAILPDAGEILYAPALPCLMS